MSTQIRVPTTITGTNQTRLDDYLSAVNDFLGIDGNEWNNTGGGGRWDAGAVFNGNLAAVTGANLQAILQHIDDLSLGGADTSITSGTLATAVADRSADFGGFDLSFTNLAEFNVLATAGSTLQGAVAAKFAAASAGNAGLTQWLNDGATNYVGLKSALSTADQTYTWPTAYPGASSGYFLGSDTGGQWAWNIPANITTGTLATATGARSVPMGSQSLTISNATSVTMQADDVSVKGKSSLAQASLRLYERSSSGQDYLQLRPASSMAAAYSIIFPSTAPPSSSGTQINGYCLGTLTSTSIGSLTWVKPPNLTQGTLETATDHRGANFAGWNLTLSGITSFTVDATEHNFRLADSTTLVARINTTGLFVSSGRSLYLTGSTSGNVGIKAPATLPISGQVYTWPDGLPASTKVLQCTNAGIMSWVDPTAGGDTSITEGALSNATASRTVPMNSQSLTFQSVGGMTIESNDGGVQIENSGGFNGGRLYFKASTGDADTIGFQAPAAITTSVLYTLPEAPASNGYVLTGNTDGTLSWQAAGADTSITSGTLATASGNRSADFGEFNLDFVNVGQFTVSSDSVNLQGDSPTSAGSVSLYDNNNSHYVTLSAAGTVSTSYNNILPDAPGSNNQVLGIVSGGGTGSLTLGWVNNGGGADTSITAGTLTTATGQRDVPFGGQNVHFNAVAAFSLNSSGDNTIVGATAAIFKDSLTTNGAETRWLEGSDNGTNYVALNAPAALTNTQTYTFPDAYPAAATGYYLTSDQVGTWSWGIPANITSGTLPTASGSRTASFAGNTLTFDNMTTYTVEANSTIFLNQTGASELARVDTSGVKLGPGKYLQFTKGDASQQTTFYQNESATTSPSYILPVGLPPSSGYVLKCDNLGNMTWGTVADTNTNITTGNLSKASANRLVDFDDLYSLTFDNMTSFTMLADATDVKLRDGTLLSRTNTSGFFVGSNKPLYFTDGASGNVGFKAPASLTTSGQVYILPNGFPGTDQYLKCDASGNLAWATPGGSSTSRQENADAMGSVSGAVNINFDSGSYDNKSYTITGNTDFTLSATRPTTYRVMLTASGGKHTLTWTQGDGDLPLYVDSAIEGNVVVHLIYHGNRWECRRTTVPTVVVTAAAIDAATSNGTVPYKFDVGRVYRSVHVTGTLANVITWDTPTNLPDGGVMQVTWATGQTNVPIISGNYVKFGSDPTHAGRTIYTAMSNSLGTVFCGSDEA